MEEQIKEPKETLEQSPAEVKEPKAEEPKEESKPKKFNIPVPKFFKNPIFIFVLLTVLTAIGGLILFFCDESNAFREKMGIKPESGQWLKSIFKIDVSIVTYVIFIVIAGSVFFVFFTLLFRKLIKKSIEKKREKKTGHSFTEKGSKIYDIIYWIIFAVVIIGIAFGLSEAFASVAGGFTARFNAIKDVGFGQALGRFVGSIGVFILWIALIPLLLLALYLLYKGAVLLFGGLAGGVARSVMQSSNFQETYAAAQAASNRINEEANQLPKSISVSLDGSPVGHGGNGGKSSLGQSSYDGILFPALDAIDKKYAKEEKTEGVEEVKPVEEVEAKPVEGEEVKVEEPKVEEKVAPKKEEKKKQNLSILVDEFQSYLVEDEKLYFSKDVLRTFIAGMAASRLLLLEGLSGTGKSSLPRKWQDFVGGKTTFLQVQATWRDRTDIIGYFSDLTGYYKETELLKAIYESHYNPNQVNLMVLDEMNISRAEYYFADFLSIYEYPSSQWKIQLMQTSAEMKLPSKIDKGALQIPTNIWFIGTINIDDSTFTVTDKVYDRAIVINFDAINEPFEAVYHKKLEPISYEELIEFFEDCQNNPKLGLTKEDKHTLFELLSFLDDTFEIKIGNRIFNQIENFVPVFVGLGGNKLDALDMMISAKIFRKLDLVFIMDMADSLIKLQRFLNSKFSKDALPLCRKKINSLLRKYQ